MYSSGASVETSRRDGFIQEFAELLSKDIGGSQLDTKAVSKVCNGIQELPADFALRLGQEDSSIEHREKMVFIHKYRRLVIRRRKCSSTSMAAVRAMFIRDEYEYGYCPYSHE